MRRFEEEYAQGTCCGVSRVVLQHRLRYLKEQSTCFPEANNVRAGHDTVSTRKMKNDTYFKETVFGRNSVLTSLLNNFLCLFAAGKWLPFIFLPTTAHTRRSSILILVTPPAAPVSLQRFWTETWWVAACSVSVVSQSRELCVCRVSG